MANMIILGYWLQIVEAGGQKLPDALRVTQLGPMQTCKMACDLSIADRSRNRGRRVKSHTPLRLSNQWGVSDSSWCS